MSSDEVISANVRHQTRKCILTIFITKLNYAKIMQKFMELQTKCTNLRGGAKALLTACLHVFLLCSFLSVKAQTCGSLSFVLQPAASYAGGHKYDVVWNNPPSSVTGIRIPLDIVTQVGDPVLFDVSATQSHLSSQIINNFGSSSPFFVVTPNSVELNVSNNSLIGYTFTNDSPSDGVILFSLFIVSNPNSCYNVLVRSGEAKCNTTTTSLCPITYQLPYPLLPLASVADCFAGSTIKGRIMYMNAPCSDLPSLTNGFVGAMVNILDPTSPNPIYLPYCVNPSTGETTVKSVPDIGTYNSCGLTIGENYMVKPQYTKAEKCG